MNIFNPLTYVAEEDKLHERTKYSQMNKHLLPAEFQQQPVSTRVRKFVMNRFTDKLTPITDRIFCLRSSNAADTQTIAQLVIYQLDFLSAEMNEYPLVRIAANCVHRLIYQYRGDFVAR
ncbi:unnamed protein product [Rotaria sordida]|uniref:Uncharacterized protein n=2 Tax=Rotaria sordida TaxID=392033 RepID=A0A819MG80_9BILA|nr:unnamed protein product [Rotaria sordida]CAF3978954.1 unnamed protein product [Rotaria sordida]